jgi:hypothetical protein
MGVCSKYNENVMEILWVKEGKKLHPQLGGGGTNI